MITKCKIPVETIPMDVIDPTGPQKIEPKYLAELLGHSFISENPDGTWTCNLNFVDQANKDAFLLAHPDVTEVI